MSSTTPVNVTAAEAIPVALVQMLNITANISNATSASAAATALYTNRKRLIASLIVMGLGVLGNFLALIILARKKHNKNSKYTYMLRCLATNDLVGLLGMFTTALLKYHFKVDEEQLPLFTRLDCIGHVVWRFFGVSSGCIAAVMAAERCMALARPFIYHKHITYELIQKAIQSMFVIALIVTFLPFSGFGAYIDESNPDKLQCIRYRDASGMMNKSYSILFMVFGTLLCVVIVVSNLFVARVLWIIGRSRTMKRHMHYNLVNREKSVRSIDPESSSGTTLYQTQFSNIPPPRQFHHSNSVNMNSNTSPDEIKFAKLMAFLSLSFVVCWMPQMIAIPMAIRENRVPKKHVFFIIADILMAIHFTLDPYIYVLSRTKSINWSLVGCVKRWRCGWRGGRLQRSQSDQSRIRTTTTEQNTLDFN